jgi:hypothetical protein
MRSVGVEVAPKPVGFDRDITSRSALSTLKNRVFDKVTDSVELRALVTGASTDPDPGSYGSEAGHVLGQNDDPVGDFCRLHFVYHLLETKTVLKGAVGEMG